MQEPVNLFLLCIFCFPLFHVTREFYWLLHRGWVVQFASRLPVSYKNELYYFSAQVVLELYEWRVPD